MWKQKLTGRSESKNINRGRICIILPPASNRGAGAHLSGAYGARRPHLTPGYRKAKVNQRVTKKTEEGEEAAAK